jgi:hypothetical protein
MPEVVAKGKEFKPGAGIWFHIIIDRIQLALSRIIFDQGQRNGLDLGRTIDGHFNFNLILNQAVDNLIRCKCGLPLSGLLMVVMPPLDRKFALLEKLSIMDSLSGSSVIILRCI